MTDVHDRAIGPKTRRMIGLIAIALVATALPAIRAVGVDRADDGADAGRTDDQGIKRRTHASAGAARLARNADRGVSQRVTGGSNRRSSRVDCEIRRKDRQHGFGRLCLAQGVPVWCGGMLETGVGRAANVALAALPGFALPGDTSASDRYFAEDITEPFVLDNGYVKVPEGPGIGVEPIPDLLEAITTSVEWIGMDRL